VFAVVAIVAVFGVDLGDAAGAADAAAEGGGDACGAVSFSGGAGPAFAVDEQGCDGDGWWLRILHLAGPTKPDARLNAPPMLTVESFEFSTGWRIAAAYDAGGVVKVRGLQVSVPPKEVRGVAMPDDPKRRGQRGWGLPSIRLNARTRRW